MQEIGTCSFRAKEESQVCKIEIVGDLNQEEDERIIIVLEDGESYDLVPGEALTESVITIIDDD